MVESRAAAFPAEVGPEPLEVRARDLTFRAYDWGGPAERPVVFLHGGAMTSHTWDGLARLLRGRYRCLAFDLRGHGDSAWPAAGDYSLEAFAADVGPVLAGLGVSAPVLVGMSLGGQTALLHAASGVVLRGLVLVDVGPEPEDAGVDTILDFIARPQAFADLEEAVAVAATLNPSRRPSALRAGLEQNLRAIPGGLTWKYDMRAFTALTDPAVRRRRSELLWAAVPEVGCSALVVRGGNSRVLSERHAVELARALRRGRHVTVAGAGHSVQGDNPRGLADALMPFLSECFVAR